MVAGKPVAYTDSEGVRHIIQECGRNVVTTFLGGRSVDFSPEEVHIDGKKWAGFAEMGIGDPIEQAKGHIEQQIKNRAHPQP